MAVKDFDTEKRYEIERVFNCFPISDEVIKKMTTNTHRTIQQSITGFCVRWLSALAEVEHYDLRNEASVKLAKELAAIPEAKRALERPLPFI